VWRRNQKEDVMTRITFEVGLKRAIIEEHRLWAGELPREQEKMSPATAIRETPQVGAIAGLEFDSGFLEVLKQKKDLPFKVA
jgi:hypothetical protein